MSRRGGYTLTVRHGPDVHREVFHELTAAVAELERRAEQVRAEGSLEKVSMLRDFEPDQQIAARLEISTGGFLRGRDAGVDVMGDGSIVPYQGGVRRQELTPRRGRSVYETVGEALKAAG
ncbi:MAG: hypothetical protein AABM29_00350 [Actinomycetota bacterium]